MEIDATLITKYNKAVPRYTSYPTVPHWQTNAPTTLQWLSAMKKSYDEAPGISLYIHLPFCEALCTYCGCNKRITKNHGVEESYIAYRQGKMHRNFMGYTANYTKCSIALGASSIGDSWEMYVQNEKQVEAYQAMVQSGKLPIVKGHQLSPTEANLRKHILNLMCKDNTAWEPGSKDAIAITPFLANLDELVVDGLVRYSANNIQVTEMGKYFIRNICAAIDPIFQYTRVDTLVFSKAI